MDIRSMRPIDPQHPLRVHGSYALTAASQMQTDSFLILHFVLDGVPLEGSPPSLLYQFLKTFFANKENLVYEEIVFNVPNEADVKLHLQRMKKLAQGLSR